MIDSDGKQNIPPWWAGYSGLFITVVTPAVSNIDTSVFHMIDQAVFIVDPAAVLTLQVAGKGFGFPDPFHAAVALNILYELVNTFDCFLS